MKPIAVILGVLGLLVGLGAGFLIWGEKEAIDVADYSALPAGREHTYVMFKKGDLWYVNQATTRDPYKPCDRPKERPIGPEADCTPMPCPPKKQNCPVDELEYWTVYDPNAEETIGVLPNCR